MVSPPGLASLFEVPDGARERNVSECGGGCRDHRVALAPGGDALFFGTADGLVILGLDLRSEGGDGSGATTDGDGAASVLWVGGIEAWAHSQPLGHDRRQEE